MEQFKIQDIEVHSSILVMGDAESNNKLPIIRDILKALLTPAEYTCLCPDLSPQNLPMGRLVRISCDNLSTSDGGDAIHSYDAMIHKMQKMNAEMNRDWILLIENPNDVMMDSETLIDCVIHARDYRVSIILAIHYDYWISRKQMATLVDVCMLASHIALKGTTYRTVYETWFDGTQSMEPIPTIFDYVGSLYPYHHRHVFFVWKPWSRKAERACKWYVASKYDKDVEDVRRLSGALKTLTWSESMVHHSDSSLPNVTTTSPTLAAVDSKDETQTIESVSSSSRTTTSTVEAVMGAATAKHDPVEQSSVNKIQIINHQHVQRMKPSSSCVEIQLKNVSSCTLMVDNHIITLSIPVFPSSDVHSSRESQ